jgi:hypothetical protein
VLGQNDLLTLIHPNGLTFVDLARPIQPDGEIIILEIHADQAECGQMEQVGESAFDGRALVDQVGDDTRRQVRGGLGQVRRYRRRSTISSPNVPGSDDASKTKNREETAQGAEANLVSGTAYGPCTFGFDASFLSRQLLLELNLPD